MPKFYDSKGNSYALNQQIGRGGEGTVFYCPDDLSLVAKIYHEAIDNEKAEKLRWMAENKNDQLLKVAAWIVDTLHDKNGNTVGFLMPNVKAKEIHELYSLKSRRVHFPEANWQFLIHTAANVARAFYVLHKDEHIMGDVNHGNCVVLADGTVKLIDCDSYSIKNGEKRYVCDVGVATHLAPELQGADLSRIEREETHDNFGLAVIIFQLLFLGRHPFAGNYLGAEDKSLEDCIREHRFAYGNEQKTNVKQPPGTLSLSQISPRLAAMFNRAFFTETRPEPHEWIEALEDLSASLKQCSVHIGHFYFNELFACPWCEIESKTGLMLFPFVSSGKNLGEQSFNIFTIENLLASLDVPQNLPAKRFKSSILPLPSEKAKELKTTNKTRLIGIGAVQLIAVSILTLIGGVGIGFIVGVVLMLMFLAVFQNSDKAGRGELQEQLANVRQEWSKLDEEWKNDHKTEQLNDDLALVRAKVAAHQSLQQQSRQEMKLLGDKVFQYNRDLYLASFHLADAKIFGVEKKHLEILSHFRIFTAADVEEENLNLIPPIVGNVKGKILEWRKELEQNFVFSPETELPEADKNRFALQFSERRTKIEKDIEQLLVSLRSGSLNLKHYQNQMVAKSEKLAQKLLQTESDIAAVGSGAMMIFVLFVTTVAIPLFGLVLQDSSSKNQSVTQHYPSTFANTTNIGKGYSSNSATNVYSNSTDYPVRENMTDEEIWQMTDWERRRSANALFVQGNKFIGGSQFEKAEKKLRYSLRFVKDDVYVLNALGQVLYEQKKYSESLKTLEKSLEINSDNEIAKLWIGKSCLKMRRFDEAIGVFLEVRTSNPSSYEADFNLGLIHKELKEHNTTSGYFLDATRISPNSAEAHYELGLSLYREGKKERAEAEYYILYDLDPDQAKKLLKVTGMKIQPRVVNRIEGGGIGSGTQR